MKVLIVSKALTSAAYRDKLNELSELGCDVVAVVPPAWGEGDAGTLESSQSPSYALVVSPIRLNGHFHLHYYPGLRRIIEEVRPDLVHLDEEPYNTATYLGIRAARSLDVPALFFTWQNLVRRYPPPFGTMEKRVYKNAAHAIAGSEAAADVLRAKGYGGAISVVPQFGVNPETFRPGPRSDGPFTIGFFNRLIPAKAPLLTLEAVAQLPPYVHLEIVGDGPMRRQVETAADRLGIYDRVRVRSRLPSSQMPDLIRGVDVVVLPSLTTSTWKEQFGRILIEAMSCGVPVVGSRSGEIPAVVGDAGIIVPEGRSSELANALRTLLEDEPLRRDLAARGRERVLREYTQRRIAERTLRSYQAVAGS